MRTLPTIWDQRCKVSLVGSHSLTAIAGQAPGVRLASDSAIRLLLVVLDRVFVPNPGLAGIHAELAQGTPLVE
jgi:hypothetical protein